MSSKVTIVKLMVTKLHLFDGPRLRRQGSQSTRSVVMHKNARSLYTSKSRAGYRYRITKKDKTVFLKSATAIYITREEY